MAADVHPDASESNPETTGIRGLYQRNRILIWVCVHPRGRLPE